MNNSKKRHDGGAYRRFQTMTTYHAKPGKDRSKAGQAQKEEEVILAIKKRAACAAPGTQAYYT